MKPGKQWTEAERLYVCEQIGLEMLQRRKPKNWMPIEDVLEWGERLIFVSARPAEFLENNRENILTGFSNIKGIEQGQQGFKHKGDVSIIDSLKAEAEEMEPGPGTPPLAKREQLKLWAKFVNHQYASWAALFELITGYKPPKMKEIAAIISGH